MNKNSILLCLALLFIGACSKEEEPLIPTQTDQFSDQTYQEKIRQMESIFSTYGWSKDSEVVYDYNDAKNRKAVEELDLMELEKFLQTFSSEEGLKNLDVQLSTETSKLDTRESFTQRAESSYGVTGSHSSAIIGSSTSAVNFKISDYERITFTSANASYSNANVSFEQVNGHHIIPFYPDANQDYYEHKGELTSIVK